MSYRCEICGEAKTGAPRIVAKGHRVKHYPQRKNDQDEIIDNGGTGTEITGEMKVCSDCTVVEHKLIAAGR